MAGKRTTSTTGSNQDIINQFNTALGGTNAQANGRSSILGNNAFAGSSANLGGTYHIGVGYGTDGPSLPGQNNTPYNDAITAPLQWGQGQLSQFVNTGILNKVPGFEPGMGMPQIQSAWQNLVESSIAFNQAGGQNWTPWDVLNSYGDAKKGSFGTKREGDWIFDVATGERLKYVGKTTKTSTDKKVDLTSAEDVKALATQALREALGRAPTAKELAQFRASINSEEKANPTVSTTTATVSQDEINEALAANRDVDWSTATTNTTTSGGVSDAARAALITEPTQKTKEYGKYQSATTYWGAMMQMIAGG